MTTTQKSPPTCKQIMSSGRYCECPALKGGNLCYFHQRDGQCKRNMKTARRVKRLVEPKRVDFRPLDDLNTEILESLEFPTLDDPAAVQVALTNVMRAVYADHINVRKARLMLDAIRHASANLHRNMLLKSWGVPPGLIDPEPIEPLGNEAGYVMPEEKEVADSMAEVNAIIAARDAEEKAAAAAEKLKR